MSTHTYKNAIRITRSRVSRDFFRSRDHWSRNPSLPGSKRWFVEPSFRGDVISKVSLRRLSNETRPEYGLERSNKSEMTTSSDGVEAIPIDFDIASKIEGEESQILMVDIGPKQLLRAESGSMLFMTEGIHMETTSGGGVSAGFRRMLTGQNFFLSDFSFRPTAGGESIGTVGLGTDFPSKIIRLNLEDYGGKLVCQKGALLCASHTVDIDMEFAKKLTAGFFGGEGFVLQALTGRGDVFVKAGGTLIQKKLAEGETLRVSSGALVAFQNGVDFDVQTVAGFKNVVFGGEGLFMTTLTGPGTVWLQGMPPDRMINEIARRVPSGGGLGFGVPIGMGGSSSGEENETPEGDTDANINPTDVTSDTEATIEQDRNATVGASGGSFDDADSPSSLFGDAAPIEDESMTSPSTSSETTAGMDEFGASSDNFGSENDFSTVGDGAQTMDDSGDFFDEGGDMFDDGFEDDTTTTFDNEGGFSSDAEEGGGGIGDMLSNLWDMFRDDEE